MVLFKLSVLLGQQPVDGTSVIPYSKTVVLNGVDHVYRDSLLVAKYTYKNGVKEGEFTEYYYSSKNELIFKETGKFVAGLKQGKAKTYSKYDNALLNGPDNHYLDGQFHGSNKVQISRDTMVNASYKKGVLDGRATFYAHYKVYDGTGDSFSRWKMFEECLFVNGVKNGYTVLVSDYYSIGQSGYYKNGLKDSTWKFYVPYGEYKGELEGYCNYVNGKREGAAESYYGQITDDVDGVLTPEFTPMNVYVEFKNDVRHGEYIKTTSDGHILEKGFYVEGKRQGQWESGKWMDGMWVTLKGEVIDDLTQGKWNCYDSKKRLRIAMNLKNDTADGSWLYYDENGNIMHERVYDMMKEVSVTNYQGMENGFSSISISYIPGDSKHLSITTLSGDVTTRETFIVLLDSMPRLDSIANAYVNVRTGNFVDTVLYRDGTMTSFMHDTLSTVQNFSMGHVHGEQIVWDYIQGVRFERTYDMDTLLDERFYFIDGRPYKGVCELITETPPNREVIRVKKGRRKGYTEYYGRLTGRFLGRVKF